MFYLDFFAAALSLICRSETPCCRNNAINRSEQSRNIEKGLIHLLRCTQKDLTVGNLAGFSPLCQSTSISVVITAPFLCHEMIAFRVWGRKKKLLSEEKQKIWPEGIEVKWRSKKKKDRQSRRIRGWKRSKKKRLFLDGRRPDCGAWKPCWLHS